MQVTKLIDLKKALAEAIHETKGSDFPKTITFNRGIEYAKYKVTIEEIEEDFFIDSKGTKWIKAKADHDIEEMNEHRLVSSKKY